MNRKYRIGFGGIALALITVVIAVGIPIREVQAQPTDPDQVAEILEQARKLYDELLPRAQRLGDAALMTRMRSLRTSWLEARGHMQGRRYRQARLLAQRNLDQLRQLATTIRKSAQRLPYYKRLAERNGELLQFLQRSIGPGAPPEILRQLTLAADAIERAQQANARRNMLHAFRLMEQSETLLRQVLRFVGRSGLTADSIEKELEETQRRIERLSAMSDLTQQAGDALQQARTIQSEARSLLAAGDLRAALTHTLTARTALRLAMRLSASAVTPEDVAAVIGHTEELQEINSRLADSDNAAVRTLWQQAERQLNQARSHLEAGRIRPALEAAQNATKLILTAVRRAGISLPPPPKAT